MVDSLRAAPVSDATFAAEIEGNRRTRQTGLVRNAFWRSQILGAVERGEDPREILNYDQRNESLTSAIVQASAKLWLAAASTVELEMTP